MANHFTPAFRRLIEIGMRGDASFGGADRYFWGLHNAIRRRETDFTATAYHFEEIERMPDENNGRVPLGSTRLPLHSRLKILRDGVLRELRTGSCGNRTPSARGQPLHPGTVIASHFALHALPLLPELSRAAHVVHFHGPWAQESNVEGQPWIHVTAKKAIENLVYGSARAFVTLSEAFRKLLIDAYKVPPHKVHVIPGGVDVERFRPGNRCAARAALGWPQDRPLLVCVRRLNSRMGLESLIRGFSRIAPRYPQAQLIIGGKGPLRLRLDALIGSLGLQEQVRLAGYIPESQLPAVYQAASATIVPSERLEGFGLTTVESLACGTPVLVTPVGGLPEIIRPLARPCVFAGTGEEPIAHGLDAFLAGKYPVPDTKTCRRYAVERFDWDRIAGQVLDVYRNAAYVSRDPASNSRLSRLP
ncbi:MAG: glycosyltransferase family 4 protein [Verrucomicrobia bacterium]|nr:glycosyltransferase family 4 protein [Verrucomicrobiota bacterium]